MHKNAKRIRNNSKFKHDTHVLVACSLYGNVLAIQTPSFPSVTPFCLSKHNEKNQVYHKQFTRKNRVGCDIKYLGAPSCLAYAGSFVVYSPPPLLEPYLRAIFSRHRAIFFATAEISISPPLPPTKSHISTVPPCFPSSNLHYCLLAAQPPRRRPFFLLRGLVDMVR